MFLVLKNNHYTIDEEDKTKLFQWKKLAYSTVKLQEALPVCWYDPETKEIYESNRKYKITNSELQEKRKSFKSFIFERKKHYGINTFEEFQKFFKILQNNFKATKFCTTFSAMVMFAPTATFDARKYVL